MKLTQEKLVEILRDRFGDDPLQWAFACPNCGDIATGQDFRDALAKHPRTHRDGSAIVASDLLGRECVGRTLGALRGPAKDWLGRGCDWAAYGLFGGPWEVVLPDGRSMDSFAPAGVS